MPTYNYECLTCGNTHEEIHRITEPHPEQCPVCFAPTLQQVLHSPAVVYKGTDWPTKEFKRK